VAILPVAWGQRLDRPLRITLPAIYCLVLCSFGQAQQLALHCDPAQTAATITLGASLHTVHGEFKVKSCEIHFNPSSAAISGEVVFDATTGQTGNSSRDRKMHKDVLESERYSEIKFRPDRVEGQVTAGATSTVQVHVYRSRSGA